MAGTSANATATWPLGALSLHGLPPEFVTQINRGNVGVSTAHSLPRLAELWTP
jgi:hypothetical protein